MMCLCDSSSQVAPGSSGLETGERQREQRKEPTNQQTTTSSTSTSTSTDNESELNSSPEPNQSNNNNNNNNDINDTELGNSSSSEKLKDNSTSFPINEMSNSSSNNPIEPAPDRSYLKTQKPKKATTKLQPSPSSASSYSNTSSLFRDDGFEDDFVSTASERTSTYQSSSSSYSSHNQHYRLSLHGRSHLNRRSFHLHHSRRQTNEGDDYQSCEEEFSNSNTSASTTSNLDDCALSITSSTILIHNDLQNLDENSLADAKRQYRKSLLLEHMQNQDLKGNSKNDSNLLNGNTSKVQALLLTTAPKFCDLVPIKNRNSISSGTSSSTSSSTTSGSGNVSSLGKQSLKVEDRTVNIIGHMPTRALGYWDSNLSITQRVVTEIIETERTYVEDLEQIVTGYICFLRNVLKQQKQSQMKNSMLMKQYSMAHIVRQTKTNKNNDLDVKRSSKALQAIEDDDKSITVLDVDITSAINGNADECQVYEAENEPLVEEEEEEEEEDDDDDDEEDDEEEVDEEAAVQVKVPVRSDIRHEKRRYSEPITKQNVRNMQNLDGAIVTASHLKNLFSNLEEIHKFNKDFLFRLEECYLNPSSVAECFVENSSGFDVYTHYCTTYPLVVSTLTELMANPASAQLLRERQEELNQGLPLGAYLLKPVQRILKYHILFESLITHTSNDETVSEKDRQLIEEAFSVMASIASHINAMKRKHEHAIRVQEVQGLLSGWKGPDLTTLGELILEDTFKLYDRPKSARHLFLFDNVLLMTKKRRDGSLNYKGHIACSNLMLIENIKGQPLVFETVPFDNPKALCAFQARNMDKKRDWCLQMKEVIIKSFEVKIPVHVRDILMSLTKSGNSDDSSDSTETMKALRAPNYLEKKKAKQDKKR